MIAIILYFLNISCEFPILYLILITMHFTSKAQKLLQQLRTQEDFDAKLREIQDKMRKRDEEIKRNYFENQQIQVDSIRRKQGFYVKVVNKRESPFPDIEKIKVYLEATLELEKNKNTNITLQRKQFITQYNNTLEALKEVTKEFRTFADEVRIIYYQKNKQIGRLNDTIKGLSYKLQTVENKYKVLGQQKLDTAKQNQIDAKLTGLGVIPFICEKMDLLFQQKLPELNFTQVELSKFKELRNDILRKFDFTISLLIRKELEKDRMDEEADLQMKYHLAKMEEYKITAEQCKRKQQESDEIAKIAREELGRQIDFIYREKKKYEHYPLQIAQLKRHQKKLENDKKKLRKTIEDLERRAKKSLGKKVQAMVAAKAAKDAQERLERQTAAFREMQIKAGYEPIQIEGIPIRPASVVEPKVQHKPQVKVQQKVEKAPSQTSSKKKKQEKKIQPQFEEQIIEETKSQKSSKKKKEEKKISPEQQGQGLEESQSQKSTKVKPKKEKEKIKSEASQGDKSEETASQNSSGKVKKQKKLPPGDPRVQKQDDSVSEVSSKSSKKGKEKQMQ